MTIFAGVLWQKPAYRWWRILHQKNRPYFPYLSQEFYRNTSHFMVLAARSVHFEDYCVILQSTRSSPQGREGWNFSDKKTQTNKISQLLWTHLQMTKTDGRTV